MNRRPTLNSEKQRNSSKPPPKSSSSAHLPATARSPDGASRSSNHRRLAHPGGSMQGSWNKSISGAPNQFDALPASDHPCRHDNQKPLPFDMRNLKLMHDSLVGIRTDGSGQSHSHNSNFEKDFPSTDICFGSKAKPLIVRGAQMEQTQFAEKGNSYSPPLNSSCVANAASISESCPISNYNRKDRTIEKSISCEESSQGNIDINDRSEDSGFLYDICPQRGSIIRLKAPLHVTNREKRNDNKHNNNMDGHCITILRPGMVLLKHYISFIDQVKLIKKCRELGLGPGGFYLPGYRDGANLNLKMMCLGKNWDPETSTYGDERPCDGAKPPVVPEEFFGLVKRAIKDSHAHLEKHFRKRNVEDVLPSMLPNICIVNFYTKSGRLGLHQDKDESQESLHRGLPVVSFSIGDSAEFLYGDDRNIDKVEKIMLESGDVLIFGGKARNIYHGVSTIFPDTAPKLLLEETNLRSGRLNLTFREY